MIQERLGRLALAFFLPFLLAGCILTPGKFTSGLTINKDRSFTFTYQGEVIAIDPGDELTRSMKSKEKEEEKEEEKEAEADKFADDTETKKATKDETPSEETERKRRAVAVALSKEAGYKSVKYLGKGKYLIDYAVSGVLTHNFIYPYNQDAEIIFPFITVELRNGNTVRMRAPGYADSSDSRNKSGMGSAGGGDSAKFLDGVFTFDTDAEIVSQNNEEGARKTNGRSVIVWKASPVTKDAPSAVLRFAK